ncbi:MAG: secretin N-terminal domain-containing protein, partial [Terracidiphilus sp.]|nr:secretin N-terminal domain-containing protein [Terracidiphilus sp.]
MKQHRMGVFSYQDRVEGRRKGLPLVPQTGPQTTLESRMNRSAARTAFVLLRPFAWAVLAVVCLSAVAAGAESPRALFKQGEAAEAREDYDAAFTAYQGAYQAKPNEVAYRAAYYRLRGQASAVHLANGRRLLQAGDEQGAMAEMLRAVEIDPSNEAAQQEIKRVRSLHQPIVSPSAEEPPQPTGDQAEINAMAPPLRLKPMSNEPITLHMAEDGKVIYQAIGKAAGVNVLIDPDYNSRRVQVDLNSVSLLDALRIVGTMTNTFWRPVTANTIFVATNNSAKRREMEELAVQTFYLSNAWQQNDLNDVQTALRNVLTSPNFKAYGVASQNAIVVRGTPDELLLAQKIVDDLDRARPEIVVD